jgi:hypothetical protein
MLQCSIVSSIVAYFLYCFLNGEEERAIVVEMFAILD